LVHVPDGPEPTARRVFWFHRPETLENQIEDHTRHRGGTLRARIPDMPELAHDPGWLRNAQFEAIRNLHLDHRERNSVGNRWLSPLLSTPLSVGATLCQ
jgi:hypothetical protein